MDKALCPICGTTVKVEQKLVLGAHVKCRVCNSSLEVIGLNPVELDTDYDEDYLADDENRKNSRSLPRCPLCGEKLDTIHKFKIGKRITCPACEAELEVVDVDPVEFYKSENGYHDYEDDYLEDGEFEDFEEVD